MATCARLYASLISAALTPGLISSLNDLGKELVQQTEILLCLCGSLTWHKPHESIVGAKGPRSVGKNPGGKECAWGEALWGVGRPQVEGDESN